MFLAFLVFLCAGCFLAVAIFSTTDMLGVSGLAVPSHPSDDSSLWRAVGYGRLFTQSYIWFGWAAYCAWLALRFGVEPDVANPWVYYFVALLATTLPVASLALTERKSAVSDEEQRHVQRGANLWRTLLLFAFCIFLVSPVLMSVPYGWLTHSQHVVVGDATRGVIARLRVAEERVIPGGDHRPYVAATALVPAEPLASAPLTVRWPSLSWLQTESRTPVEPCQWKPDEHPPEQNEQLPEDQRSECEEQPIERATARR